MNATILERGSTDDALRAGPPGSIRFLYNSAVGDGAVPFGLEHNCPSGCGELSFCGFKPYYLEGPSWTFNGDTARPTIAPSVQVRHACQWHGFLENGAWRTA